MKHLHHERMLDDILKPHHPGLIASGIHLLRRELGC
jgi:hypothetical protein